MKRLRCLVDMGASFNLIDAKAAVGINTIEINPVTIRSGLERQGHKCNKAIYTRLTLSEVFRIAKFTALIQDLYSITFDMIIGNQILCDCTIFGNGKYNEPTLMIDAVIKKNL